ncbi:hypothetical protein [Riemerella columbina]|uniref:hypothetical protein n=1 Tax=Riemerella columbina TaxID=103810 RepID=UPI00036EE4A7|nr:hypothetical protein [Riemerella columbina]
MKKNITKLIGLVVFLKTATGLVYGQYEGKVGINTQTPKATLEINVANINKNATTKEGVLIPRVSRKRASDMGIGLEESTLIYIDDITGTATGTTANVDATGFYYFKENKWHKLGANAVASTNTRYVWNTRTDNGTTITVGPNDDLIRMTNDAGGNIIMPNVVTSRGRHLCFYNEGSGGFVMGPDDEVGVSGVQAGLSACFISDGVNWVSISAY